MSDFPVGGFYFSVDYGGEYPFQEVSGLGAEYDLDEVVNGIQNGSMMKVPKKIKYAPLVLKKGIIKSDQFKSLLNRIGNIDENLKDKVSQQKKELTIKLLDEKGGIVMTFKIKDAIPIKYSIGSFNAKENSIAIEELSFIYRKIEIS